MKIYSWNILYYNEEFNRAFEFIAKSDFDIFCLQEVPESFLQRLQTLPYHIAFRSERELHFKDTTLHNYVVILSKHPIVTQGEIPFPEYWHLLPLRTKLFVHVMSHKLFTKIRNRAAIYADVMIRGQSVRVFNLHLILAQPAWRLKEFELAMIHRSPSQPTVVCGDFNILEKPHITLLNWILGGPTSDALLHRRERTTIEKHFVGHELENPLRGKITHSLSRSQLDHILVSDSLVIKRAEVLPDSVGSDHNPIFVEIK